MARFRLTADLAYRRLVVSLVESTSVTENAREPRIGVLVVAYNAVTTLASVLDRIPQDFRERIDEIFVCDDASQDATHLVPWVTSRRCRTCR